MVRVRKQMKALQRMLKPVSRVEIRMLIVVLVLITLLQAKEVRYDKARLDPETIKKLIEYNKKKTDLNVTDLLEKEREDILEKLVKKKKEAPEHESNAQEKESKVQSINLAEEENKIESFRAGKNAYKQNLFEDALQHFIEAQNIIQNMTVSKEQEELRKSAGLYKAKTLFELGEFKAAQSELIQLRTLESEAQKLLQKTFKYSQITEASDEKEITEALRECSHSPYLLKLRIAKRIKKGTYGLALLDIKTLATIKSQREYAERLEMHCKFLQGKYMQGLTLLEKQKDCHTLYQKAKNVIARYNSIGHVPTAMAYQNLKTFIDSTLAVAKAFDVRFTPSIFSTLKIEALERAVKFAQALNKPAEAIKYSEKYLSELLHPTEIDQINHIKLLLAANKFQTAKAIITTKLTTPEKIQRAKDLYNEQAQKLRKIQEKEEEQKRKKEEEDAIKAQKEELEKEKKRSQRRQEFVRSKRGRIYDSEGYYRILKLPKNSSIETVMDAYRTISRNCSMNRRKKKNPEEADKSRQELIKANKAKEILTNEIKKKEYDSGLYMTEKEKEEWGYNDEMMERYEQQGGYDNHGYDAQQEILKMILGGGGGNFGGFGDFNGFGGGGFSGGRRRVVYYHQM
ncbi:hypothetical protein NEOKW01_0596 [Nematocida sp. AWRm80]|nr:hypothetical protein NEOKW01_0596 [Nematocida sp. AWRm80]